MEKIMKKTKNTLKEVKNKSWMYFLMRRRIVTILLLAIQLAFIIYLIFSSSLLSSTIALFLNALSVIVCIHIVNKSEKSSFKLAWVFMIMAFPLFGGMLYLFFMTQKSLRRFKEKYSENEREIGPLFFKNGDCLEKAVKDCPESAGRMRYLQNKCAFPVFSSSECEYFPSGVKKLERLKEELEKAEKYIFIEYFIICGGKMWSEIFDILVRKAAEGIKVRIIYDDIGSFFFLPSNYPKILASYGIECMVFNKFRPFLTTASNNRDHRKIVSVDGKVAFTGGINISDEYIGEIEKHGRWKDSAVMIKGDGAWSLTLIFLEMWQICCAEKRCPFKADEDLTVFYPGKSDIEHQGYVQHYADSPLDREYVGENVYTSIISSSQKYLYITTPYLIVDDAMTESLVYAAKRGVDVRIITPEIGDHWYVHTTTRSYYHDLISNGVRIFEYKDGFCHAKLFVSDDAVATVGTVNLDYRSLYHHFECGCCFMDEKVIEDVKRDFFDTENESREIKAQDCKRGFFISVIQTLLRLMAPLM